MGYKDIGKVGAILGIIQGILGAAGSLVGILFYLEAIKITSLDAFVEGALYVIFVSPISFEVNNLNISSRIFYKFLCSYLALNLAWLFTSIALIQVLKQHKLSVTKSMFAFKALLVLGISAIDLTLTIMIGVDIYTWHDLTISSGIYGDIVTANVIVLVLTARGGLFWLINVIFAILYIKQALVIENNPTPRQPITPYPTTPLAWVPANTNVGGGRGFVNSGYDNQHENMYGAPTNQIYDDNITHIPRTPTAPTSPYRNQTFFPHHKKSFPSSVGSLPRPESIEPAPPLMHIPRPDYSPIGQPKFKPALKKFNDNGNQFHY